MPHLLTSPFMILALSPLWCACDMPPSCEELTSKMTSCGEIPEDTWQEFCDIAYLSDTCLNKLDKASCGDQAVSVGGMMATEEDSLSFQEAFQACFPPCEADQELTCHSGYAGYAGDHIKSCLSSGLLTYEVTIVCEKVCSSDGGTYSGTCSDRYGAQRSSTGMDVCWCEEDIRR